MTDLSDFTRGARLLDRLKAMRPGECFMLRRNDLADIVVPANPLDNQTPEYLVEWFRIRLPFACEVREYIERGDWVFERRIEPKPPVRRFAPSVAPRWPSPCAAGGSVGTERLQD